jgi:hypothetical protein
MQPTIKHLRQQGYKVRVMHKRLYRYVEKIDGKSMEMLARGGSTTIELTNPDKDLTVFGTSVCSTEDNFNRHTGNAIALGRALSNLKVKKDLLNCPAA